MGFVSASSKLLLSGTSLGQLPWAWVVPGIVAAVLVGIGIAVLLERRVPPARARTLAILLAGLGAAAAIVRGLTQLA